MNLRGYLDLLARRWLTVVVVGALCVGASLGLSLTATPVYTASASLFFSLQTGNNANELAQGSNFTQNQMASYAALATTAAVLSPVIAELDLSTDPRDLARQVRASTPNDTVVLEIRATSSSAGQAADIANSVAEQLTVAVDGLAPVDAIGKPTVTSAVVDPAEEPEFQTSPNTRANLVIGALLALILGGLAALLREALDTRVRTADDLGHVTSLPLLASLDTPSGSAGGRDLVVVGAPRSPRAESFRSLRTAVQFTARPGTPMSLLVTSSRPAEGKSTVAANLALTLAEAGMRVALVDADLRRPSVADTFDLEGAAGLTSVLIGRAELGDVLQEWGRSGLHVLTTGPLPPNPSELLGSPAMADLLRQLEVSHDVVVLDGAPLLPVTDAAVLARLTSATLVVADASRTRRPVLAEALTTLARVEARVTGVVLTHVRQNTAEVYGYESISPGPARTRGWWRRLVGAIRPARTARAKAAATARAGLLLNPPAPRREPVTVAGNGGRTPRS